MIDRLVWQEHGRDWPNRTTSRFVKAHGFTWHVQIMGSGPILLLLHGTGASTHSWSRAAQHLAERFTVVIPDLPGHAFTDTPPDHDLSLKGMAEAVAALLETLGPQPDLVAGHSAGAAILIRMALDRLIAPKGIVSFNGALLPFHGIAGRIFSPLAKLLVLNPLTPIFFTWRAGNRNAVERVLRGTGSIIPPESIDLYARLFSCRTHVSATLRMMALWDLDSLAADLPQLAVPLLLVAAANDTAIPPAAADRVARLLKSARVEPMTAAGHLSHEEKPEATADLLVRFAGSVGLDVI